MKKLLTITALLLLSVSANAQSLSKALQAKMDYLSQRQNIVSSNIANASTPDYLAQDLVYKASPQKSNGTMRMAATSAKHMAPAGFSSTYERTFDKTFIRNDGNSVRIDDQMLKMAQIQQEHTMATRLYSKHLAMQKLLVKSQ